MLKTIFSKNLQKYIYLNKNFKFCDKLDLNTYVKEVDKIMHNIFDKIDEKEYDITENITYTEGVLNIRFSPNKNYVLNIQRPNLQIWLSSPFSGPQRFEFDKETKTWKQIRTGENILDILEKEFNQILKMNNINEELNLKI
jgi:frataxin